MIDYIEGVAGLKPRNTHIDGWSNASNINDLLRDGKMECGSCHNPHDKRWPMYLKHRTNNSELCFTCHDK
jgi:predicted CXXCH cytochrome family protein